MGFVVDGIAEPFIRIAIRQRAAVGDASTTPAYTLHGIQRVPTGGSITLQCYRDTRVTEHLQTELTPAIVPG